MATATRFQVPFAQPVDSNGKPVAGGQLFFYDTASSTPAVTYADEERTVPNANPVVADAAGRFPSIFLPAKKLKAVLKNAVGGVVWTADPITAINLAADIEYLPPWTGAVPRTADDKLREVVSVTDFGAVGNGTASDQTALNAMIAHCNNSGGGVTVNWPAGDYLLTGPLDPITVNDVYFSGEGASSTTILPAGGAALTWGSDTGSQIIGGGIEGMGFRYISAPSTSLCVDIRNATRLWFDDIQFDKARCIASIGSADKAASLTFWSNLRGSVANTDSPGIDLIQGAGLYVYDSSLYVDGVGVPVHPDPMATAAGRDFVRAVAKAWDTISLDSVILERFDRPILLAPSASGVVVNNVWLNNVVLDYCKTNAVRVTPGTSATVFGLHVTGCWLTAWEGVALQFDGPGMSWSHEITGSRMFLCGGSALSIGANTRHVTVSGNHLYGANRKALGAATVVVAGEDVNLSGNNIGYDTTVVGLPYQGVYAVAVAADLAAYTITGNDLYGSAGALQIGDNATGSIRRRISGNSGDNYVGPASTGIFVLPATGVAWINTTPHKVQAHIHGGTVSAISKNGTNIAGMTAGSLLLDPGEQFVITYSADPSVTFFRLG